MRQTVVIKYGGSVRDEPTYLLEEIAYHAQHGVQVVIVHGGGPEITHFLARVGHSSQFVEGQRVTDEETLDVVEMVLAGRVGKRIVRALQQFGAKAVSICGEDGNFVRTAPYSEDERLGLVGRVQEVDPTLLTILLDAGFIPVIAPLGMDQTGQLRNINADFVAGALASALSADAFILATDVPGVKESPHSLHALPSLTTKRALQLIEQGAVTGGMIPKVLATVQAVEGGAREACIVDGRRSGILDAILRGDVIGTRLCADDRGTCDKPNFDRRTMEHIVFD